MKQIIRYRYLLINNKLSGDIRLVMDKNPEYNSTYDGGISNNLTLYPIIGLSIIRNEINEEGKRIKQTWNMNDHLSMTKFSLPIMIRELKCIEKDMFIPDLYQYNKNILELNTTKAELSRRVFIIGSTTLELSPVVLEEDEKRLEGIKMKFNNESSVVGLTLNELRSLIYNLEHLDVDNICIQLFFHYNKTKSTNVSNVVDIIPPKRNDIL